MANKRNDLKEIRREEAEERQAAWDALSDEEKLAKVDARLQLNPNMDEDSVYYSNEARKIRRAS